MKTILSLLLLATVVSCRTASTPAIRDIDAFAANVVRTIPEVPSVAIAVVQDGKKHTNAFGYADRENKVAATTDTGYYIGSTTKGFTGYAAAVLAERGTIDLDAPITKYLPEVKFGANIDANGVTLRKLLSHSAKIQHFPIVFRTAFSGEQTPELLIKLLNDASPRAEAFRYDNLGYVIAGLIFERVTGKSWQQLHEELVFKPLGMTRSTAWMSKAKQIAMPYELLSSGNIELLTYRKTDAMMHAAGGTVMSANDLARWLEVNLSDTKAIVEIQKAQAGTERPRPPFAGTAYGFGWYRGTHGADELLFHGGGFEGWRSLFTAMPQRKLAVGVLTNSGISNPVNQLITGYAYDRLLNKPNVESEYAAKLAKLRADIDKLRSSTVEETTKRAERRWQLTRPLASYTGRYEHAQWGTLVIEERGGKLIASMGTMRAELEPFTDADSARVELIPASGEVIRFPEEGVVKFRDEVFVRAR
jgi:CubicO group peptidase (beta-lactamase class C family)